MIMNKRAKFEAPGQFNMGRNKRSTALPPVFDMPQVKLAKKQEVPKDKFMNAASELKKCMASEKMIRCIAAPQLVTYMNHTPYRSVSRIKKLLTPCFKTMKQDITKVSVT